MTDPGASVLLLRPPVREFLISPLQSASGRSYPIGLAYLAAALRREGLPVSVLDAWARPELARAPLPKELSYLRGLSDLHYCAGQAAYYRQGMSDDLIRAQLRECRPTVVGISSMFSGYHPEALRWADEAKRLLPDAKVVVGGSAATASPELTLRRPSVDFVVLGEGESSFPKLARALLGGDESAARGIPGVGFKVDGRVRLSPRRGFIAELDGLARPAYDLIDHSFYRVAAGGRQEPYVGLFTSRGCPHLCDFCTIYLSMGRRFRVHSPERVLGEIRHCHDRFGVRVFHIEDDNFAFEPERAKAILRLVVREFGPRKLVFRNFNGMTALSLRDRELVGLMGKAGFDFAMIALESNDPEVRRVMKKPGTVGHFTESAGACEDAGIRVGAFTIVGLPYSSVEKDVDTQLFCLTQPMRMTAPVMFYPIPTTPQYERCVEEGWVRPEERFLARLRAEAFVAARPGYSRRDAFTLVNLGRLFDALKSAAKPYAADGLSSWRDVARRHAQAHPCRVTSKAGELVLEAEGRDLLECDVLFFQVQTFLESGTLLGVRERSAQRVALKAARASAKVVRSFRARLPGYPVRCLGGARVRFD